MKDNAWIAIVATVAIIVCIGVPVGCVVNEDYLISQDIKNGANPIDASCAHTISPNTTECMMRAALAPKEKPLQGNK